MLTLRLHPHAKDDRFWMVLCDDVAIGVIVQPGGSDHWHWSITVQASVRCPMSGKTASREAAMIEFRTAWVSFETELGPPAGSGTWLTWRSSPRERKDGDHERG